MAAAFEQDIISRDLKCPICFSLLSDPKQLYCSHTFCQKCLTNMLTCSSRVNKLKCPICREMTKVQYGYVENLEKLKRRVDDVLIGRQTCDTCGGESVKFCCECGKKMCTACLQKHNTWQPNLDHKVVKIEDIREGRVPLEKKVYCQEKVHKSDKLKEVCTDVCTTCKKFVCTRCRMLYHEKEDHTVQDTGKYSTSFKAKVESLLASGKTKVRVMKKDVTFVENQREIVNDHINRRKDEINQICQESINKLNKRKAEMHTQLNKLRDEFYSKLNEIKIADEKLVAKIESASVLAGDSLNVPLDGDTVTIRDFLSKDLKDAVGEGRHFSKTKNASDLTKHASNLILNVNTHRDQLEIGNLRFVSCAEAYDTELPTKDSLNDMAATLGGKMAVGNHSGGIHIFSKRSSWRTWEYECSLNQTVLEKVKVLSVGFLSDGRCVVLNTNNTMSVTSTVYNIIPDLKFQTINYDEGGYSNVAVDSNDRIYVSYRKAKKIQIFSQAGGKAVREISWGRNEPEQIFCMGEKLVVRADNTVFVASATGKVLHEKSRRNTSPFPAVTEAQSILIAWIKNKKLVSIELYTDTLQHIKTLVSDFEIQETKRQWYCLQEFKSEGAIALCSPDTLYVWEVSNTPATSVNVPREPERPIGGSIGLVGGPVGAAIGAGISAALSGFLLK